MTGDHSMERCRELTKDVLRAVFSHLYTQRVMLEGMILKANMVLPGLACPKQESVNEVADATVKVYCKLFRPQFRRLRSCRAANPVSWLRRV
jgi:fructose-bisphosphate aldolase class 1